MFRHLEEMKKRQNKEELLNKKQAKKRSEAKTRQLEDETPPKVKRVEVEIEGTNVDKETNITTNSTVGKRFICRLCKNVFFSVEICSYHVVSLWYYLFYSLSYL